MCQGVSSCFRINYFWLNYLYIYPQHRGKGLAIKALNMVLVQLPAYSVLAGHAYKISETNTRDIIRFYKKHHFHICRNTIGNEGDPIIFTFVKNK